MQHSHVGRRSRVSRSTSSGRGSRAVARCAARTNGRSRNSASTARIAPTSRATGSASHGHAARRPLACSCRNERELLAVSWAWSPRTNGPLAGDVVYVDARTPQEYERRFAGRLRGKWVMIGAAYPNVNPDGPPLTAADSAHLDSPRRARLAADRRRAPVHASALLADGRRKDRRA